MYSTLYTDVFTMRSTQNSTNW